MQIHGSTRDDIQPGSDRSGDGGRLGQATLPELPAGTVIRQQRDTAPRRITGLDLGKSADYAALATLERVKRKTGQYRILPGQTEIVAVGPNRYPEHRPVAIAETETEHHIRYLKRWEIGTSYTIVVRETIEYLEKLLALGETENAEEHARAGNPADWLPAGSPILAVDQTGVGNAVVDMFRTYPCPTPMIGITITGGETSMGQTQTDQSYRPWTVPKKELVAPMLVAAQNSTLKISPQLPLAATLTKEMQAFRLKLNATGGHTFEAERERDHDDLVLAVAMASWIAHRIDIGGAGFNR